MEKLPWHNDFPRTADEIAAIVAADLPAIAPVVAKTLGAGWDYTTFVVNDRWVFRFPKRHQTARALLREIDMLDGLARELDASRIAVPRYRHRVERSITYPTGYAGYALLPGRPLLGLDCEHGERIAREVGEFLGALHRVTPTEPKRVRDELPDWVPDFRRELDKTAAGMPPHLAEAGRALLATSPPAMSQAPRFTHADLGVEHILVDESTHRVTGIIDWGDAGWADPIGDFVGLWTWGGDRVAAAALDAARTEIGQASWTRLRYWGACYAMGTAYYGYNSGQVSLLETALSWLERMYRNRQLANPGNGDD